MEEYSKNGRKLRPRKSSGAAPAHRSEGPAYSTSRDFNRERPQREFSSDRPNRSGYQGSDRPHRAGGYQGQDHGGHSSSYQGHKP